MSNAYKPEGYTSLSPYLVVYSASDTVAFLERVFDAVELRRFTNPDGSIAHAELRIDDTVLMLSDRAAEWPALPSHVHIYVPDVDETFRRALEAGATAVQEPTKKDDSDRRAGVTDAGGTTWWIATLVDG